MVTKETNMRNNIKLDLISVLMCTFLGELTVSSTDLERPKIMHRCIAILHLLHRNKKDYNSVRLYYNSMKSLISAKISTELYEEARAAIKEKKYVSKTECIIEGLILLLRNQDIEDSELNLLLKKKEKEVQNLQDEVNSSKIEVQALKKK
jgi:Arc/MetJ-type ribon-helix-helix transcriptional regulator